MDLRMVGEPEGGAGNIVAGQAEGVTDIDTTG